MNLGCLFTGSFELDGDQDFLLHMIPAGFVELNGILADTLSHNLPISE
jgi:hypothetical protein